MNNTTNLSSFPTSIDTFERMSDISGKPIADGEQSTLEKSKIYKEIIEAGNYEDAEKYLKENEDLAKCAINASMINKHSDAIVAVEENVKFKNSMNNIITTNGTASAYTLSFPDYTGYTAGDTFTIKFHTSSANSASLNINNLGAIPIAYRNKLLKYNAIKANDVFMVQYLCDAGDYIFNIIGQACPETEIYIGTDPEFDGVILYNSIDSYTNGYVGIAGDGGTKVMKNDSGIKISSPDMSPAFAEKNIGNIELYPDGSYTSPYKFNLYQRAFSITDPSAFSINPGYVHIPDTMWTDANGLTEDTVLRRLICVEGVLVTKDNYVYPIGYNDGTKYVNAYYGQTILDSSKMQVIINYTGISSSDIKAVKGILKYSTETA